ncbi:MAG: MnhB domain-containing protein [Deltaproteobacteria bacterium]|jgi:multisubunit Na+/H+ antiporter MnhB subunit|nr:MnhB domain-containing protein [Deltaproteobacteria bacterium]MBW2477091.1 MnhB domain-containing protein [Deltaproteobacteria bacterium]MBW2504678.1 MnhB domain-containing protein [Deltaproteobacteria bacterium]MBW2518814.1 MnhB domain-containing protein [Deltaproteobacteria bacterium]
MTSRAHIAEVFMRGLYPVLIIASFWMLLRGHNAPGGGFIAGLMAVAASSAYALIFNSSKASKKMPLLPARLSVSGVLVALASGLPAVFQGLPYLSHPWWTLSLGGFKLSLSTVMLFDLGVYLAVWGAIGGICLHLIETIEENL